MIGRFHGIDRHKAYSTISVLDREGQEVRFVGACDLRAYLKELGAEDAVVLEASGGSFWWADRKRGAGSAVFRAGSERVPHHHRLVEQDRPPGFAQHGQGAVGVHGDG